MSFSAFSYNSGSNSVILTATDFTLKAVTSDLVQQYVPGAHTNLNEREQERNQNIGREAHNLIKGIGAALHEDPGHVVAGAHVKAVPQVTNGGRED